MATVQTLDSGTSAPASNRDTMSAADIERLSSLGRLAIVMAHEIRNPLMMMRMSLRALRRAAPTPEQQEAIRDLQEEVERLTRLATDVLDFARPIHFDFAPADVNLICAASAEAVMAGEPGPPVRLALDPSLSVVVTDADRLRTVLVNLLTNARQAVAALAPEPPVPMPEGSIEIETKRLAGDRIGIVVRDRGIGISPADLPRVFEPYFTTKRAGTGVGLPIAKNIINGLDGKLAIRSEPGVGTEVSLDLPGRPVAALEPAVTPKSRPRVLVIEDDPSIRTLLATCLELEGFAVATASNGADGLDRIKAARPSLVLLDLMMPVMDGVQFRAAQLKDPEIASVPVVCISAIDDAEQRDGQLRAAAYITKPFDLDRIMAVVRARCQAQVE